jgi:ketosteroid isomerase-like protein
MKGKNAADWNLENQDLDTRMITAMSRKDIDGVMSCFANSPELIAVLWGTEMHGVAELRRAVESIFSECEQLQLRIDRISRVRNGDNVLAVGHATYVMVRGGVPSTVRELWTDARRKVDGRWVYMLNHAEILAGT